MDKKYRKLHREFKRQMKANHKKWKKEHRDDSSFGAFAFFMVLMLFMAVGGMVGVK